MQFFGPAAMASCESLLVLQMRVGGGKRRYILFHYFES